MNFNKIFPIVIIAALFLAFGLFILTRDTSPDKVFFNHVKFIGKITSFNKSDNHSFGIVKVKVFQSNVKNFSVDNLKEKLFPFRIDGNYAEFYGYIPIEIKIGDIVELDSDKASFKYYNSKNDYAETTLFMSDETTNIDFVNKHSSF
jgi:hypothetical protein